MQSTKDMENVENVGQEANTMGHIRRLVDLATKRAHLEAEMAEVDAEIKELKAVLPDEMTEAEIPETVLRGYKVSLNAKTYYNKKSDTALMAEGIDFFDVLRNEGMGDLIKQTVNAQSLRAAVRSHVEEHGELGEGLASIINPYEAVEVECKPYKAKKR